MRRFLKAELNTIIRKPKMYVLLGILLAVYALGFITYILTKHKVDLTVLLIALFHPFLVIILVSDVTHKEYKFNTMKNLIGSGFTRSQIYTGKLIVTMLVAFVFMFIEKLMEVIYYLYKGTLSSEFFWKAELVDIIRQFCMFGIIYIICMLITSDALSLLAAFGYGILLKPVLTVAALLSGFVPEKVAERIGAAALVSSDCYVRTVLDKKGYPIGKEVITSELIWCAIGLVVAIIALQGGFMLFKRKEFK